MSGTNQFFNNYQASGEQQLLDELIVESIRIYGQDMLYLPRSLQNYDSIFEQSDLVTYSSFYQLPLYIESFDGSGFTADKFFLSKFGVEIHTQIVLSVARSSFYNEVTTDRADLVRPREGDLIYFPLNNALFQINYCDNFSLFYQLGSLQTWKMTCELFKYSDERFNTGIPEIDSIETHTSDLLYWAYRDDSGNPLTDEEGAYIVNDDYEVDPLDDADEIQTESDLFIDFSDQNPFGEE